jgi:hypothetical protein
LSDVVCQLEKDGSRSGGKDIVVDGADVWVASEEAKPVKARFVIKCNLSHLMKLF